ncbi:MAG: helix-turn-helix domain-containing protein, partial [Ignavibacteriaceae bacterium]|nr:helix-turn-helix domain-containing protein [Ignavibacteriaceae bacterium]
MKDSLYISLNEAAKILGISKPTLYRWIKQKKINFYKPGGKIFFTEADLHKAMNGGKDAAG